VQHSLTHFTYGFSKKSLSPDPFEPVKSSLKYDPLETSVGIWWEIFRDYFLMAISTKRLLKLRLDFFRILDRLVFRLTVFPFTRISLISFTTKLANHIEETYTKYIGAPLK
jgi:hypothetical protein